MSEVPLYAYVGFILLFKVSEWVVVARSGSWKRRPRKDWTLPVVIVPYILAVVSPVVEYESAGRSPSYFGYVLGGLLFMVATALRTKGHLDLKGGFTPYVEKLEGRELVDRGIYRYIRHPLYLAMICLSVACPLFLSAYYSLVFAVLSIAGLLVRIWREEMSLSVHMAGYAGYRKRTWALLPGVF